MVHRIPYGKLVGIFGRFPDNAKGNLILVETVDAFIYYRQENRGIIGYEILVVFADWYETRKALTVTNGCRSYNSQVFVDRLAKNSFNCVPDSVY